MTDEGANLVVLKRARSELDAVYVAKLLNFNFIYFQYCCKKTKTKQK